MVDSLLYISPPSHASLSRGVLIPISPLALPHNFSYLVDLLTSFSSVVDLDDFDAEAFVERYCSGTLIVVSLYHLCVFLSAAIIISLSLFKCTPYFRAPYVVHALIFVASLYFIHRMILLTSSPYLFVYMCSLQPARGGARSHLR